MTGRPSPAVRCTHKAITSFFTAWTRVRSKWQTWGSAPVLMPMRPLSRVPATSKRTICSIWSQTSLQPPSHQMESTWSPEITFQSRFGMSATQKNRSVAPFWMKDWNRSYAIWSKMKPYTMNLAWLLMLMAILYWRAATTIASMWWISREPIHNTSSVTKRQLSVDLSPSLCPSPRWITIENYW